MDKVLCKCVNDIDNNGIVNLLHYMNLKIHYPGLTSKKDENRLLPTDPIYRQSFFVDMSPKFWNFNFTQDVKDNFQRAYGVLVDDNKGAKHLDNEYQWQVWKRDMKSLMIQDHYEVEMFLYYTLNRKLEDKFDNVHFHYGFKVHN